MPLERESIEKHDFPIGRRGYDQGAVDAHLTEIAVEVEEFTSASRRRRKTLAAIASRQVRVIVESGTASLLARRRRREPEPPDAVLQRLDAMERELLARLQGLPAVEPVQRAPEPATVAPEPATVAPEPDAGVLAGGPLATGEQDAPAASPEVPLAPPDADDDAAGARLIVLNMAANGASREETDRYLSENYTMSETERERLFASLDSITWIS